jgi:putative endonuclease
MKGFFSYILRCADGTLYSGATVSPEERLKAHNEGRGARYTRGRKPVRVAALWQWSDWGTALRAERRVKELTRLEKLALTENPEQITSIFQAVPLKCFTPSESEKLNCKDPQN